MNMKTIQTVLKEMAQKVLAETPEFDTSECVTMQFSASNDYNDFFVEMAHSRGWDKQRKQNEITNEQQAHGHMIEMLNAEIEVING
jgi:hypothetical protein